MGDRRIETLGDLVHRFPTAAIALGCQGCGRTGRYLARDLAAARGGWRILRDLRFRCDGCGSADVGSAIVDPTSRHVPVEERSDLRAATRAFRGRTP